MRTGIVKKPLGDEFKSGDIVDIVPNNAKMIDLSVKEIFEVKDGEIVIRKRIIANDGNSELCMKKCSVDDVDIKTRKKAATVSK